MTGSQSLLARGVMGAALAIVSVIGTSVPRLRSGSTRAFEFACAAAFLGSRLFLYCFIFGVLKIQPRGDVPGFYFPEALRILQGGVPYRDFATSYAPLHPYIDGIMLLLWSSPLMLILCAIAGESLLLPIWFKTARSIFPEEQVRIAALLYIMSPISFQFVTLDGQDNVVIALVLVLATFFILQRKMFSSGALVGLAVGCVKFLPLLFVPLYALASRRPARWMLGLTFTIAIIYLPFAPLGHLLILPMIFEGKEVTASNVPFLVESLSGWSHRGELDQVTLLIALALVLVLVARALSRSSSLKYRARVTTKGSVALTLTLLLLSKKSWPPYTVLVLFPMCLLVGEGNHRKIHIIAFSVFSGVSLLSHSFWATVFHQDLPSAIHAALMSGQPNAFAFICLQIAQLTGYFWLLLVALRRIRQDAASIVISPTSELAESNA